MDFRKDARESVSYTGLMLINQFAYDIYIRNLSVSGALICIDASSTLYDQPDMFMLIQYTAIVDIYIENTELTSKANIIRVDFDGDQLLIGLEFQQTNKPYQRESQRKNLTETGYITLSKQFDKFMTLNISNHGMMVKLEDYALVKQGMFTTFGFATLSQAGNAKVAWVKYGENNGMLFGLQYQP